LEVGWRAFGCDKCRRAAVESDRRRFRSIIRSTVGTQSGEIAREKVGIIREVEVVVDTAAMQRLMRNRAHAIP